MPLWSEKFALFICREVAPSCTQPLATAAPTQPCIVHGSFCGLSEDATLSSAMAPAKRSVIVRLQHIIIPDPPPFAALM